MIATAPVGPVLKWAGGKRQLLTQLRPFFPARVERYFEPFFGSGAVFFDLCSSGRIDPRVARLSDDNADLVGTYLRIVDSTDALLTELMTLARGHEAAGPTYYYRVRDERFNPGRRAWLRDSGESQRYPVRLAAMLIYLNRTGYNGLFRLNANGEFNVPAGRYHSPRIVNDDRITAAAAVLGQTRITQSRFEHALRSTRAGDVVYLDPPYAPLSRTANFRAYTASGFSHADQQGLHERIVALANRGVEIILSNSTAPEIVELYEGGAARAAGLRCFRVHARRAINTDASRRGYVDELVVTNRRP